MNYKYLLIYACLILNSNAATRFGSSGSSSSRSSFSGFSKPNSNFIKGSGSNGRSSLPSYSRNPVSFSPSSFKGGVPTFPNNPIISIADAKKAYRMPSNVVHTTPNFNFKPQITNTQATPSAFNYIPVSNVHNNVEQKSGSKLLNFLVKHAVSYISKRKSGLHSQTYPPHDDLFQQPHYEDKSATHLMDESKDQTMGANTNKSATRTWKISPDGRNIIYNRRAKKSKNVTHIPAYLSVSPMDFINSFPQFKNSNIETDSPAYSKNVSKFNKKSGKYAKLGDDRMFSQSPLMGLRGYTMPAIFQHNLYKYQQLRKAAHKREEPSYARAQVIFLIVLAIVIIFTISTTFYVKLRTVES